MGPWVLVILLVFGCAAPAPELAPDEIDARDVRMPAGAKPGMFITWSIEESEPDETTVVEETIACVAPHTIEWRKTFQDGRTVVTAARFRPDGMLLGAWRGPAGGAGEPLRPVERKFDVEAAKKAADRAGKRAGITDSATFEQELATEDVVTPAGTFRCVRRTIKGSLLFVKVRYDHWYAREGELPLDRLVRIKIRGVGQHLDQILAAYGTLGAKPTLRIP